MRQLFRSKFKITQEYGVNYDYYKKFGLKGHEGIDLIPTGTVWDVLCLEDGVVVKDEDNPRSGNYGNYITVWCNKINKATQYCHLKENYVDYGQLVKRGDKLGLMGATGNVTGAHLHLNLFITDANGIRQNKNNGYLGGIDPFTFLNEDVEPVDTSALDECKKQVADEIKNKNETFQELVETRTELEASQSEITSHKNFQTQLAVSLKTDDQPTSILGQITKLLSEEDQLRQVLADNQTLKSSKTTLTAELAREKERADNALLQNKTVVDQLQTAKEAIFRLNGELALSNQEYQPLFTIFNLIVCKK